MKLSNITGIIFDLGGTLFRPVSDMCGLTRDFLSEAGHGEARDFPDEVIISAIEKPDEWLNNYMVENDVGVHWEPQREHWIEYDRLLLDALGVKDHENIVHNYQQQWDNFHEDAMHELVEGCLEALEKLKSRGFKLGVASNRFADPERLLRNSRI